MSDQFTYDVFLCHSEKDRDVVRSLAERLRDDGLKVWFDEWEVQSDEFAPFKIEEGLSLSRTLILVMSEEAFAADWGRLERCTSLFRDPINHQRRFVPLRLDDAEIPDSLRSFAFLDWRNRDEHEFKRLKSVCKSLTEEKKLVTKHKNFGRALNSKTFRGQGKTITAIAVTEDGNTIISGCRDGSIEVRNTKSDGGVVTPLKGPKEPIDGISITPKGDIAVTVSGDRQTLVWDIMEKNWPENVHWSTTVNCASITANGNIIVSANFKDQFITVWNSVFRVIEASLRGKQKGITCLAITPDGDRIISGSFDKTVDIWQWSSNELIRRIEGHLKAIRGIAITPDGNTAISCGEDRTVRVWDIQKNRCISVLEGHLQVVRSVAITSDGRIAISGSDDGTVRVWNLSNGESLATLEIETSVKQVTISSNGDVIIALSDVGDVWVWEMPSYNNLIVKENVAYTNAKVLLVGESGVGKTGLAMRLTTDNFVPTLSTDGVWASQIKMPNTEDSTDTEREIWLWDFAGQSDYRLIHQLFMDGTSLAVLVFNPQNENPFEALGQWDRALQRSSRHPFKKLLVAGRCDVGSLMTSKRQLESFIEERSFDNYLETSAKTGANCNELKQEIINRIPWQDIPWTASPRIFKLLKKQIIQLKSSGCVLLRLTELKQQIEIHLPEESFTLDELRTVVSLLVGPGIVWQLDFGDFVLLQPELINAYAAAVIRKVRAHTEEIGCIREDDVHNGNLDYQWSRLPYNEEQIVLRAMHQTFIERGLCLREPTETGTLLVFPSYFKRERPDLGDHPAAFVTYQFNGMPEEIYATLVVRLHHTATFDKDQLWYNAADFKTPAGKRVGLKMTKKQEGLAEITLYFEAGVPDDMKVTFIRYVHEHLTTKDPNLLRERHYVCPECHTPVTSREIVRKKIAEGRQQIICVNCEKQVPLFDLIEEKFASEEVHAAIKRLDDLVGQNIDNESRELVLVGHAFAIAGEAGQIFRPIPNSDWGIDGEIEFKNNSNQASGKRVYLQLKSGDSYLPKRKSDGKEIFTIKNERHIEYWQAHAYPVMLVIRTSDGTIRWMNVTEYLKKHGKNTKQIIFDGEPFTAQALWLMKDRLLGA